MGILKKILKEIQVPDTDLTQQIRILCNQIKDQEKPKMKYPELAPDGSTVFLSLEVPGRYNWEIGFLTLEKEDNETYIIVYHTLEKNRIDQNDIEKTVPPRRRKVWVINENKKAEKILTQYITKLKMLQGG